MLVNHKLGEASDSVIFWKIFVKFHHLDFTRTEFMKNPSILEGEVEVK